MTGFEAFLVLIVVGAICSLDTVSVGQVMIARPIVSATAGAAVLGRPAEGVVVGAVMELFAIETMPFGASRYPEWGSAGVVAGVAYVIGGVGAPGSLAVATLLKECSALSEVAQIELARLYEDGWDDVLPPHDKQILACFERTAKDGFVPARRILARVYAKGIGLQPDLPKAKAMLKGLPRQEANALLAEFGTGDRR